MNRDDPTERNSGRTKLSNTCSCRASLGKRTFVTGPPEFGQGKLKNPLQQAVQENKSGQELWDNYLEVLKARVPTDRPGPLEP